MRPPRMASDGPGFLPAAVQHAAFRRDGVLVGRERNGAVLLHWAVIDTSRHTLSVWEKSSWSLAGSAPVSGASVVTNGPFTNYGARTFGRAVVRATGDVVRPQGRARRAAVRERFEARRPLGHVRGGLAGVRETSASRERLHHFGRRSGTGFDSYVIAQGDPGPELVEVVGGLFRTVTDFRPYGRRDLMRTGFWGLAPLVDNPVLGSRELGTGAPDGVVVFAAGWTRTGALAATIAGVGVSDAVQIDGGGSLLFGAGGRLVYGRFMPPWKRSLQRWGLQFRP